ncbi:thermonuclease family protein [Ilyomonas limi]|nr:thermonuclease family protein [Ilyomonas limi]
MFSNCTPALAQSTARVVRVKDGDTYVFRSGARVFTVRLTKVDAPEMKQAFGFTAYQCVNQLLTGKAVEYDSVGKDLYGRVLVSVKLDGKRLDSLLIRNGWAWHYIAYDTETMLDNLMNEAIMTHSGLWACGVNHVCPPWLYRSYNERNRAKYCKGCTNYLLTQK